MEKHKARVANISRAILGIRVRQLSTHKHNRPRLAGLYWV